MNTQNLPIKPFKLLLLATLFLSAIIAAFIAIYLGATFDRLMGEAEDFLFPFLPSKELRGVTREWLCFVLPLLAIESWNNWLPALRTARRRQLRIGRRRRH